VFLLIIVLIEAEFVLEECPREEPLSLSSNYCLARPNNSNIQILEIREKYSQINPKNKKYFLLSAPNDLFLLAMFFSLIANIC